MKLICPHLCKKKWWDLFLFTKKMSMLFTFREESFHVEVNKLCKMSHACLTGLLVDRRVFVQDSYKTLQILQWPSQGLFTRGGLTPEPYCTVIYFYFRILAGFKRLHWSFQGSSEITELRHNVTKINRSRLMPNLYWPHRMLENLKCIWAFEQLINLALAKWLLGLKVWIEFQATRNSNNLHSNSLTLIV